MKMPFFGNPTPKESPTTTNNMEQDVEDSCTCACSLAEPEAISYASEFRDFLQNNAPLDFETKMARARPFIFSSFIAWPTYWLYRGMDWSNKAVVERSLVNYINRTFHHAKIMQFTILGMGLLVATYEDSQFLHKVNHMLRGLEEVDYSGKYKVMD